MTEVTNGADYLLVREQVTATLGFPSRVTFRDGQASVLSLPGQRPLDVLIVTSEAPPIVSGISTCIKRLANGLIGRGHHVSVLSSAQIPRLAVGEWRLSSFAIYWPRIARELRHFDVVNVHGPVPTMSDAFLRLSGWLPPHARPAIVYTHHSPIDIRGATRMSARYNRLHDSLALRADRIVASSRHYANQHRSRYGPLVRTIPWGVDARASSPSRGTVPLWGAAGAVRWADASLQRGGDTAGRCRKATMAEAHPGRRGSRTRELPAACGAPGSH